jgi:uncharacterized protein
LGRDLRPAFYYHPVIGLNGPITLLRGKSPLPSSSPPPSPVPLNSVTGGSMRNTKSNLNTCIVTGEDREAKDLIRFVLSPDDVIVPDIAEKLPGKAFYVTAHRDILKKAIWRNSFTGAAKQAVITPKDLLEQLQLGLLRAALETLSLCKKSGDLVFGFAKLEELFRADKAHVYLVASDASDHGRDKLEKLFKGNAVLETFTSRQLSASVGETHIMHVGLKPSSLTEKIMILTTKLENIK